MPICLWLDNVTVTGQTGDEKVQDRLRAGTLPSDDLGQVVRTRVPLSPSSIIWYRSKGGDALRLGR